MNQDITLRIGPAERAERLRLDRQQDEERKRREREEREKKQKEREEELRKKAEEVDAEAMLVFASQHEKVLRESMAKKPRSTLQHSVAVDKAAKEGRKLDEQAQEKEELAQIFLEFLEFLDYHSGSR